MTNLDIAQSLAIAGTVIFLIAAFYSATDGRKGMTLLYLFIASMQATTYFQLEKLQ